MTEKAPTTTYPLSALRALTLHTQRLTHPNGSSSAPTSASIVDLVTDLGYVQIDTINVVNRAHEVTLWSRLGSYEVDRFHQLIYASGKRKLYEGWGHAACIIPLKYYRYHQWRTNTHISFNPTFSKWLKVDGNRELLTHTLERIRSEGGLRVGAFKYDGPQRSPWYDWKPPKMALEALFAYGDLMVADRVNFQRVYDLRERVLPDWVDTTPVNPDEGRRFLLEQAAKSLGVFAPRHLTLYAYMRASPAQSLVKALIDEGVIVKIQGESSHGRQSWMVHRQNLPLLQRAADGDLQPERTTFLSPFDSLFWAWQRDEQLWGFKQVLECYKPADKRVYGYFSHPILHKDRLVGRFDPKLDRTSGIMHINTLYLEPGIEPDDELVAAAAAAMRDFLAWHGASSLNIASSQPSAFAGKLMRAL